MNIISTSPRQTQSIAFELAKRLKSGDLVALIGNLGSGKTVFVKGLASGLGCLKSKVLSPTFVLMHQYNGKQILNHFDLYRLKDIRQLEDIGYEEYFYGEGVTVVEWADRVKKALPEKYTKVEFKVLDKNKRLIKISVCG